MVPSSGRRQHFCDDESEAAAAQCNDNGSQHSMSPLTDDSLNIMTSLTALCLITCVRRLMPCIVTSSLTRNGHIPSSEEHCSAASPSMPDAFASEEAKEARTSWRESEGRCCKAIWGGGGGSSPPPLQSLVATKSLQPRPDQTSNARRRRRILLEKARAQRCADNTHC